MTLVNQYPSISKILQQATFAYRATKQQLRYVENICPPHVAEFYFQLFTFIKHILLHNMQRWGSKRTKRLLVIPPFHFLSWRYVLLVEKTGVPQENHRPVASHWHTLSYKYLTTNMEIGIDCTSSCKSNDHTTTTAFSVSEYGYFGNITFDRERVSNGQSEHNL